MKKHCIIQFRAFGFVIRLKDSRKHHLFFSERNGYGARRFGPFVVSWMRAIQL